MKLEDTKEAYEYHTGKASELSRQLSFAALAVIWIFKVDGKASVVVPHALLWPAALAIASLAFDILQYIYSSAAWGIYNTRKEHELSMNTNADFFPPATINWPSNFFFYGKLAAVILSYAGLLAFLFSQLWR